MRTREAARRRPGASRRPLVTLALGLLLAATALAIPEDARRPPGALLVALHTGGDTAGDTAGHADARTARGVDVGRDVIWVLAVGSDARPGEDMTHSRGDAIQMVGVDTRTGAAAIIGVPRDSWVSIPGHGMGKINSALFFGGPRLFGRVVGDLVGIRPDYVFVTRFEKFQALVNGIGGIDLRNPSAFADRPLKPKGFPAGRLHLSGYDAMAYSRIRHDLLRGDFDRSAHQQLVVEAIQRKVRSRRHRPGFLARGVLSVMRNLHTDLSPVELFKLAHALADVDSRRVSACVVQGAIGNEGGQSVVLPFVAQARQMGRDAREDAVISRCVG